MIYHHHLLLTSAVFTLYITSACCGDKFLIHFSNYGEKVLTCFAMAEYLSAWRVSSNILAHWLTLTTMQALPCPLK